MWPSIKKNALVRVTAPTHYRSDIDGLRAVAVLSVVLYHLDLFGFSGGYVGVDIFFVISGYLITQILMSDAHVGRFDVVRFYERRARRILPALLFMFAVVFFAAFFICMPTELTGLGKSAIATIFFSSNLLFWLQQGYFDPTSSTQPLLHCWSLAVEEQFYIFYPLILVVIYKYVQKRFFLNLSLFVMAASSLIASEIAMHFNALSSAFYLMPLRGWELLVGALLAVGAVPSAGRLSGSIGAFGGICCILFAVFGYDHNTPFPGFSAILPVAGSAALIWAGCNTNSFFTRFLSFRPLVFVGLISYSLYLWHWPIWVLSRFFLLHEPLLYERFVILSASFIIAILSWRYVEIPFRKKNILNSRIALFQGAVVAGVVTIVIGTIFYTSHGLPQRLTEGSHLLADGATDRRYGEDFCSDIPLGFGRGLCAIGKKNTDRDILFWGDSHAWAMKDAFNNVLIANNHGGYIADFLGCSPLFGVERVNYSVPCQALNENLKSFLLYKKIKIVVIIASWRGIIGPQANTDIIYRGNKTIDVVSRNAVFKKSLSDTLSTLHGLGIKTVFLMPLPGARLDVPNTLARADMLHKHIELRYSRNAYDRQYAELIETIAENRYNLDAVVNLQDSICGHGMCQIVHNSHPLYFDENHPSKTFETILEPVLSLNLKQYMVPRLSRLSGTKGGKILSEAG